jgi:hypothetical protein
MTVAAIAELRSLSDRQLAFLADQLEVKIASLRVPTTSSAAAMKQQYIDRLDAVRAEQERRRV